MDLSERLPPPPPSERIDARFKFETVNTKSKISTVPWKHFIDKIRINSTRMGCMLRLTKSDVYFSIIESRIVVVVIIINI
jgi:hypothetical protein